MAASNPIELTVDVDFFDDDDVDTDDDDDDFLEDLSSWLLPLCLRSGKKTFKWLKHIIPSVSMQTFVLDLCYVQRVEVGANLLGS